MSVAHVDLMHRDPCECKVKGFYAVSSIERNVSTKHLQRDATLTWFANSISPLETISQHVTSTSCSTTLN